MPPLIQLVQKDTTQGAIVVIVGWFVLLAILVVAGMAFGRSRYRKRKARREVWGKKHGLQLLDPAGINERLGSYGETEISGQILRDYPGFGLAEADQPMAKHILEGCIDGFGIRVFDYRCASGSGEDTITTDYAIVAIELPRSVGGISLQSRRIKDGVPREWDLPFPKPAFNKRFHVFQDDERYLHDRMDSDLEKRLIESPIYRATASGHILVARAVNKISDDKYESLLGASLGLAKLLAS